MLLAHLSPLASSLFSLLVIGSLLLAFVMLGSRWLKDYLLAFTAESWLIALLSGTVGSVGSQIEKVRAEARAEHGWVMDTYLLRRP